MVNREAVYERFSQNNVHNDAILEPRCNVNQSGYQGGGRGVYNQRSYLHLTEQFKNLRSMKRNFSGDHMNKLRK